MLRYTLSREDDPTAILTNSNTDTTINPTTGMPWGVTTPQVPGLYTTDPNRVANNLPTFITSDTNIAQLTVKADLNFADLTSYSQWRRENVNQSENLDQTGLPIFQLGLPIDNSTISQEFLLTSKPGTRLQWTAGAFYFNNKDEWFTYIDNFVNTPAGRITLGGSGTTTENIAGFFDATYAVTPDKFFVTVGARYSHDTVKDAFWDTPFTRAAQLRAVHQQRQSNATRGPPLQADRSIEHLRVIYRRVQGCDHRRRRLLSGWSRFPMQSDTSGRRARV